MRAREPDRAGLAEVDGVRVGYEIFGTGEITIVLVPSWTIVHSRFWKGQVPYLSRHFRVVTFDNPGNGRSDRPEDPAAYGVDRRAQAALAVMEETGTGRAVVACLSAGAQVGLWLAAHVPERVLGTVYIGAAVPFGNTPPHPDRAAAAARFDQPYTKTDGWYKYNRQYWLDQYEDFATFFFQTCFPEPHSTKQIEDCIGWAAA